MKIETYQAAKLIQDNLSMINKNLRIIESLLEQMESSEKPIIYSLEITTTELGQCRIDGPENGLDNKIEPIPIQKPFKEFLQQYKKWLHLKKAGLEEEFENL